MEETLTAECSPHQKIVINRATYGRMRLGRCVKLEWELGCSGDVSTVVGTWCTGKQRCKHQIVKADFTDLHNCPEEIDGYMDVDYTCRNGIYT